MVILHKPSETNFNKNGKANLKGAIVRGSLTHKLNGACMITIEMLKGEPKTGAIKKEDIISCPTPFGIQSFRVFDINPISVDRVQIVARHIFFDLQKRVVKRSKVDNSNGQFILDKYLLNLDKPVPHKLYSNLKSLVSLDWQLKKGVDILLGDEDNSFINKFGKGELRVDGFKGYIDERIGRDRGFKARFRKNITGFSGKTSTDGLLTRIIPKGFDGITLPNDGVVDSELINNYADIYANVVDFPNVKWKDSPNNSDKQGFDTLEQAQAELRKVAKAYFTETGCDIIKASFNIDLIMLKDMVEYQDVALSEEIQLGDTISIDYSPYDIKMKKRLTGYTYNILTEKMETLEIGDFGQDYFKGVNDKINNLPSLGDVAEVIDNGMAEKIEEVTNAIISGGNGSYVKFKPNAINPSEILVLDNENEALAKKVIRINKEGIGVSTTGLTGNYYGLLVNGQLVINEATATKIVASIIEGGILTSKDKSSYLNLDNGEFSLKDKISFVNGKFVMKLASGETIENALGGKANNSTVTNLSNKLTDVDSKVLENIRGISNLLNSVTGLETDLSGLNTEITKTNQKVTEIIVENGKITNRVSETEKTTTKLTTDVETAQNTANSKAKTFVATPTIPYKIGDLWLQGTSGEVMKCKVTRNSGNYVATDWEKASKYTDDTKANAVDGRVTTLNGKVNLVEGEIDKTNIKVAEVTTEIGEITTRVSATDTEVVTLQGQMTTANNNITNTNNKLDGLQIGGRNLLIWTNTTKTITINSPTGYVATDIYGTKNSAKDTRNGLTFSELGFKANDEITISFNWNTRQNGTNSIINGKFKLEFRKNGTYKDWASGFENITSDNGTVKTTCKLTGVSLDSNQLCVRIDNSRLLLDISNCKLEKGNKATDWTPSPEDVEANINAVDIKVEATSSKVGEIKTTVDGISQKVSATETKVTTIDGKITTATGDINTLKGQVTATNNKVASIESTVNGISSKVSSVESSVTTINGNITSLTSRMATAESKITANAIINTVTDTINSAKNEAINSANSSTDNKLKPYAKTSDVTQTVDSWVAKFSSSGGYNLLKDSNLIKNTQFYWWHPKVGTVYQNRNYGFGFYTPIQQQCGLYQTVLLKANTNYTLSGILVAEGSTNGATLTADIGGVGHTANANGDNRISVTFNTGVNTSANLGVIHRGSHNHSGGFVVWVKELLLVEGELALPWSPHPSEIYEGSTVIDGSGVTINNGDITIKDVNGAIALKGHVDGGLQVNNIYGLNGLGFNSGNSKEIMVGSTGNGSAPRLEFRNAGYSFWGAERGNETMEIGMPTNIGGHLNATTLRVTSNGTSKNILVGDDAYFGDCNEVHTIRLMSASDNSKGKLRLGGGSTGSYLLGGDVSLDTYGFDNSPHFGRNFTVYHGQPGSGGARFVIDADKSLVYRNLLVDGDCKPYYSGRHWLGSNNPDNKWAGVCCVGGTLGSSDIHTKENIERLDGSLVSFNELDKEILEFQLKHLKKSNRASQSDYYDFIKDRFKPSYYNYKLSDRGTKEGSEFLDVETEYNMFKNVGFIAQDYNLKTDNVAKEFIFANEEGELSYNHMSYVTVGMIALQEATRKIESLEAENLELKARLERIEKLLNI